MLAFAPVSQHDVAKEVRRWLHVEEDVPGVGAPPLASSWRVGWVN